MNDFYNDPYENPYENPGDFRSDPNTGTFRQEHSGSLALATAAFILCLIGGATFFIFYFSVPLAALSIILALLSRGDGKTSIRGKIAVIISVIDIIVSISFTGYAACSIFNDPVQRRQFERLWDYYMDYYSSESDGDMLRDFLEDYGLDSDGYDEFGGHDYDTDDPYQFVQDLDGQEFVWLDNPANAREKKGEVLL